MAYLDAGALVISALPALEPISATALAINISYLNLERFRYRKRIRDPAREQVALLRKVGDSFLESIRDQDQTVELVWLAAIDDADKNNPTSPLKRPRSIGPWGWVYRILFHQHIDLWLSGIMTAISLGALFIGPIHELNLAPWSEKYFIGVGAWASWIVLSSCALLPVVFVFMGRRVVKWGEERVAHTGKQLKQLEMLMQGDAKEAAKTFVTEQTTSEEQL